MVATVVPMKAKGGEENVIDASEENETNKAKPIGCCKRRLCWSLAKLFASVVLLAFFLILFVGEIYELQYRMESNYVEVELSFQRPRNVTFPSITVCNNNPIQKSKFCEKYPEYCENPTSNNPSHGPIIKSSSYYRFMSNLSSTETIPLGQKWQDFAKSCLRVHHNREGNMDCKHVTNIYWSLTNQNCFTFLGGEDKLTGDYRKAALWLVLDFQPEENTENNTIVGGQLFIHDPDNRIPEGFPMSSHTLKPGKMYRFRLKQTNYYRLPAPFETGCKYYDDDSSVSSKEECYNKCLYDKFISSCGCMPDIIPFFDMGHSTSYCKSDNASKNCEKAERNTIEDYCDELCPIKCTERSYRVKVDEFDIPKFNHDIEDARKNLANIWIKFDTNEQLSYNEIPVMHDVGLRIYIAVLLAFVVLLLLLMVIRAMAEMYRICKLGSTKN